MHSVIAGFGVALLIGIVAHLKGRTGWHWFLLSLFAFTAAGIASTLMLYVADVGTNFATADRLLALAIGVLTCAVMLILVLSVPARPRGHSPALGVVRRDAHR